MTAQHTPAPWFWALDGKDQPTSLMRSGTGDYVASPQADIGDYGLSVDRWIDVSEADALLIAAAPELLAALTEIIGAYSFYFKESNPWGDKARAAIAKATGQ